MATKIRPTIEVTVEATYKEAHNGYWFEVWKEKFEQGNRLAGYDGTWADPQDAIKAGKKWAKRNGFKVFESIINPRS